MNILRERTLNFEKARDLLIDLKKYSKTHLSQSELARFGVKVSSFNIDSGVSKDSGPTFCAPFPEAPFENRFQQLATRPIWPDEPDTHPYCAALEFDIILGQYLGVHYCSEDLVHASPWSRRA